MEWWHVYLFTRLDSINTLFVTLFAVGLLGTIIAFVGGWMAHDWAKTFGADDNREYTSAFGRLMKAAPILMIVGGLVSVAVPTQKEAAAIYLLPKLTNSDFAKEAQQLPSDMAKLMRLKLESRINDMDPIKAEKK